MKRFKPFQIIAFILALVISVCVFILIQMAKTGGHSCGCGGGYAIDIMLSLLGGFMSFVVLMLALHRPR